MGSLGRIFITGANGYIGSTITEFAIADGYEVHGLSRSQSGDDKLKSLGAVPVRGDLTSLDVLGQQASESDMVIHLATAYQLGDRYEDVMPIENAALDAMAAQMAGTNKCLVATGGTLFYAPDPSGAETNESSPPHPNPISTRQKGEQYALDLVQKGIRVCSVRLAPYVYGRGGSGVKLFMEMASKSGRVVVVDGGKNHTTTVHVEDAARLYLLVAQKGRAGEVYNAGGATNVTASQLYQAMAAALNLGVVDISSEEALATFGPALMTYFSRENRASGMKAVKELGWEPTGPGILDEIETGSYQAVATSLRSQ